jgi:hypothetical protein
MVALLRCLTPSSRVCTGPVSDPGLDDGQIGNPSYDGENERCWRLETAEMTSMWTLTVLRDNMTNRWGVFSLARQGWKLSRRLFRAVTHKKCSPGLIHIFLLFAVALTLAVPASASWKEKVLYSFQGGTNDGSVPAGGVVFDKAGNLYGATTDGGMVYQLAPPAKQGDPWTETILYVFQGNSKGDGANPSGGLVIDGSGNLYGVTAYGGTGNCVLLGGLVGCGTVYEVSPPKVRGEPWTETVLYSFPTAKQGYLPNGDLVFDSAGNLYGATTFGGSKGTTCDGFYGGQCGVVFKLNPPKTKGGKWTEKVLHNFASGTDGANPNGGLVLDGKGNVYGTTFGGGNESGECGTGGCGTAFQLSPSAQKGGVWTDKVLYRFNGQNGANPAAGPVFGRDGKLYGTASAGVTSGNGAVFDLAAPPGGGGLWKETVLYRFTDGIDGTSPQTSPIFDASGNLYGVALGGGTHRGVVFRLKPLKRGNSWPLTVLYNLTGSPDGDHPTAALTFDGKGNLYSTTEWGGTGQACQGGCGAVFEVSP